MSDVPGIDARRHPTSRSARRPNLADVENDIPSEPVHLSELSVSPVIQNIDDTALTCRSESLEDAHRSSHNAQSGHHDSRLGLRAKARSSGGYENLNELVIPEPVENVDEAPVYRHRSLEERFNEPRGPESGLEASSEGISKRRRRTRALPGRVSDFSTELYIASYLIFFSILGTLARLGLRALTAYPGAPVTFGLLWVNFAGTLVLGFLAQSSKAFAEKAVDSSENDDIDPAPEPSNPARPSSASTENNHTGFHGDIVVNSGLGSGSGGAPDQPISQPQQRKPSVASKAKFHKPTPLYIGLATGFCGSVTSFSSFALDAFLACLNSLSVPAYHTDDTISVPIPRAAGMDFMAFVAIILLTLCTALSALKLGAHAAIAAAHVHPWSVSWIPHRGLDKAAVFVAFASWATTIALATHPPTMWQGAPRAVLFALAFAPAGCIARFALSRRLNGVYSSFPLGTFVVNIGGTLLLGAFWDVQRTAAAGVGVGVWAVQGAGDGFCGCLTTVSTWVAELGALRRRHAYVYGMATLAAAVVGLVLVVGTVEWTIGSRYDLG